MTRALALCALVAALVAGTATAAPSPADLESELVCPVCGTTLDQSDAPIALKMKRYIRQRLAAGASEQQIKAELVDQFGPAVLAEPLLLPVALLLVGLVAWGWSRRRGEEADDEPVALDPELERRVDAELQRFES